MSGPRIGALFAGYGGLEQGVQAALGGSVAWVSEIDKGACKILAHHWPDVPNIGDITKVDWSVVEPVDILTGGSPCQDLSHAGKRGGMTEGTRSNLWVAMREAIAQLRPGLVVWENVRGAYSAAADSALESDPRLLADTRRRDGEPVLRALGRVLGDLSELGYVGGWHGLRAADVGAPHGRFRVFVVAYPASNKGRVEHGDGGAAAHDKRSGRVGLRSAQLAGSPGHAAGNSEAATDPRSVRRGAGWTTRPREAPGGRAPADLAGRGDPPLMPTPRATDGTKGGPNQRGSSGDLMLPSAVTHLLPTPTTQDGANTGGASQFDRNSIPLNALVTLLPTPAVNDMGEGKTIEAWDEWTDTMKAKHGNGNGHGASLAIEAQRLLPTPRASDGPEATSHARSWSSTDRNLHNVAREQEWGQYAAAIAHWESLTRPAPPPTELGPKGNPRLSAAFSEWLMGLPAGHITDAPGITRNEALKAAGNGVVPQQAEAAVRFLLSVIP